MQASQMTFGVEIECSLTNSTIRNRGIRVGNYHGGIQVPDLPYGWTAERDGSIQPGRGRQAVEIVSPILQGAAGLQQAMDVLRALKGWGAKVNRSTGLHIHVNAGLKDNLRATLRLVHLVAKFERALFGLTGTRSREHGHYSQPVSYDYQRIRNATSMEQVQGAAQKYRSLNLKPLFTSKGTVEFRVFQGTLNPTKLAGYVQACLGLVERAIAMKRTPQWRCTDVRYQDATGLTYWMLRNLNWNSFKRLGDRRYGVLLPATIKRVKKEFKRLTKKYDAQGRSPHHALRPAISAAA